MAFPNITFIHIDAVCQGMPRTICPLTSVDNLEHPWFHRVSS
jgi:hypothetical protein